MSGLGKTALLLSLSAAYYSGWWHCCDLVTRHHTTPCQLLAFQPCSSTALPSLQFPPWPPHPPLETHAATECHIFNLHQLNDSLPPKESWTETRRGAELQQGKRGGGTRLRLKILRWKAPVTCSILALLLSRQEPINAPLLSPAAVCGSVCLFLSQWTRVSECKVRTAELRKSIPEPWHAALCTDSPALPWDTGCRPVPRCPQTSYVFGNGRLGKRVCISP